MLQSEVFLLNITVDMLCRELRQFAGKVIMLTIWTESGKSSTWNGFLDVKKCRLDDSDSDEDALRISMSTGNLTILDISMIDEYGSRLVSLGKDEDKLMFAIKMSDSSTITFTIKVKKPSYTDIVAPDDLIKYLFHIPFENSNVE